jgi:hypothetical protein
MFLSLYDEVTNVLCVSLLSHDRSQYGRLIVSKQTWAYPVNTCNSCCNVKDADVVLTSRKNARKQMFIFPLRYYANCVSTTLTVLITFKVSISFIVNLYIHRYSYLDRCTENFFNQVKDIQKMLIRSFLLCLLIPLHVSASRCHLQGLQFAYL